MMMGSTALGVKDVATLLRSRIMYDRESANSVMATNKRMRLGLRALRSCQMQMTKRTEYMPRKLRAW